MLKVIISREILDHILSLRFIVGLSLCVIVTITCVIILTHDYGQELKDYNQRIALQDDFLNNYAHTNRLWGMIRPEKPPETFRPLITGVPKDADLGSLDDNPLPVLFPPLDLVFIVTIVISLMAILFSYDAVCGERENGTLKLMLSGCISKANVLSGKWIGGMVSLFIPFLLSLLAGVLYILLNPVIQWHGSEWTTFILLILASATFISIFYLLGLLVSTRTRIPSTSILTSLFLWVLLILAIPNLSPYLAAQLYRIPSVNRIEKETNRIQGIDRDNMGRKLQAEVTERFAEQYGELFNQFRTMNQGMIRQRAAGDPEFKIMFEAYREEVSQAWRTANQIQGEKARQIRRELDMKAAIQTWIAKHLACISPYANFIYLVTDLTGTGLRSTRYFQRAVGEFYRIHTPYIEKKVREATERDPTFNNNSFLDISDRPRFRFQEEPLKDRFIAILPYWGILLFFNVLFFLIAFVGFLKYDLR